MAYHLLLFYLISSGNVECAEEVIIRSLFKSTAMVNTSIILTCFTCLDMANRPAFRPSFSIASSMIPLNDDVTQVAHQIFVSNFSSFPLLMDGVLNRFQCLDSVGASVSRNVSTLSKFINISHFVLSKFSFFFFYLVLFFFVASFCLPLHN